MVPRIIYENWCWFVLHINEDKPRENASANEHEGESNEICKLLTEEIFELSLKYVKSWFRICLTLDNWDLFSCKLQFPESIGKLQVGFQVEHLFFCWLIQSRALCWRHKGQLIWEWLFCVLNFPKITTPKFEGFLP